MKSVQEPAIRRSFVNCTKGEAQRLALPRDLSSRPWDDLDFLGWQDPATLDRSYLVAEHSGQLVGVALRVATARRGSSNNGMCSLCLTTHTGAGVVLMTGNRAGAAGRQGNSVGLYICADLGCSLYVRGLRKPESGARMPESLTLQEQIDRTQAKVAGFLDRILA